MRETDGHTKTLGLLGYPVAHTLSPLIHSRLAEYYGDNLVYLPFEVEPDKIGKAVEGAFALGIAGLNVTVPHKAAVIPYLSGIDPLAGAVGAVNTLIRKEDGFWGCNTDMPGLFAAMQDHDIAIKGESVLILGAGGAARAATALCVREGAKKIVIANRSEDKARELAGMAKELAQKQEAGEVIVESTSLSEAADILGEDMYLAIQCTSVGLAPDDQACVLTGKGEEIFSRIHTGVDLIYKPRETVFLKKLKAQGKKIMNGHRMLLYQGVIAYEMWRGDYQGRMQTPKKVLDEIMDVMEAL